MEQHAAVAHFDSDGKITLWSATQTPHYVHRALAKVLGLPASHIRVIATPNGGGFGGKSDPFNHEVVVCKLSMMTGRPVKVTLTREEVFYCHRGRHPVLMKVKTGVKNDGAITAMHFQSYLDGGAYGSYGVASTFYTGALQTVTYDVPRYKFQGMRTFTNKPPCGPKRGHWHAARDVRAGSSARQDRRAVDSSIRSRFVALTLVDAEYCDGELPAHRQHGFGRVHRQGVEGSVERTLFVGQNNRKLRLAKGIGIACSSYICGAGLPIYWNNMPQSGVQLRLDRQGGVCVMCGSTDIGQDRIRYCLHRR
jgi:CO/xanthine dehydrogenase Mo-binding subunit